MTIKCNTLSTLAAFVVAGISFNVLAKDIPAQYALPQIKATNAGTFQDRWLVMIKQIESAVPDTRKMLTIEEAVRYGQDK